MGNPGQRISSASDQAEKHGLRILYTNARSIVNKIQELKLHVLDTNPDMIAITETWTHSAISNDYLSIPDYYIAARHDRTDTLNGRGGGILIYVKSKWKSCETTTQCAFNQFASVKIASLNAPVSIIVIYRSPNSSKTNNDALIEMLRGVSGQVIVLGDFNYPAANWNALTGCIDSQPLIDLSLDKFWSQSVDFATHTSGNILDLVFAEDGLVDDVQADGLLGSSDHSMIMIETNFSPVHSSNINKRLNYQKADFNAIRESFNEQNWRDVIVDEVNSSWDNFKEIYDRTVQECIPTFHPKKRSNPAWMNRELLQLVQQKRKLWKKYNTARSAENWNEFKKASQSLKKRIRRTKLNFEKMIARNSKENPKAFYAYLGGKKSNRTGVGPLQNANGEMVLDDAVQAKLLNDYYGSVFETENPLPHPHSCAWENVPLMESLEINPAMVKEEIKKLKRFSSPGPDGIANVVLIEACEELAGPLSKIFQQSIQQSTVPLDWRSANVTPVHKGGTKKSVANYRPISLTSTISKILESIIRSAIMSHLLVNNLIKSSQHGFMRKKSCLTNLLHALEEVTSILDDGDCVDILYLDFSKAFDKVQHQRLLSKMRAMNIDDKVLAWVKAWLSNRSQRVVLNGKASNSIPVPCSVGQGTVLGPLIFIIFIDDIDECIESLLALILKFADDTKIIKRIRSQAENNEMQVIINNLSNWAKKWQMYFNVDKCKILHLGRNNPKFQYLMDGVLIKAAESERDLGVVMDCSAKPSLQCAKAAMKANQVLGQLLRTFQCRNKDVLTQLFKVFVRPHLEYAVQAWSPYTMKDIDLLEKVQRRMVRQISGIKGTYEEKLVQIGLTTLQDRRERGDCIEIFKMMKGFTNVDQTIWFDKILRTEGPQTRLSADPWALELKPARLDLRKNFFSIRAVHSWNALPFAIKQSTTINQFKNSYDKYKSIEK